MGYFTESFPTNFHHFYKRKTLVGNETADMFKDVTASEKSAIEAQDAKWVEPSASLKERWKLLFPDGDYIEKTGFFKLNDIDTLTADEAKEIECWATKLRGDKGSAYARFLGRTMTTYVEGGGLETNIFGICYAAARLESFRFSGATGKVILSRWEHAFRYCQKLHTIFGTLDCINLAATIHAPFAFCFCLTTVELHNLKADLFLGDSPLLSLASLQYLVNNAANTSPITVTVHPEVYAKLTDETNTEWKAIFTAAEDRQIEFATTE